MITFLCAIGAIILGQFAMYAFASLEVHNSKFHNVRPMDKAFSFALLFAALGLAFYAGVAQ